MRGGHRFSDWQRRHGSESPCSQRSGPTSRKPIGTTQATSPLHLLRSGGASHSRTFADFAFVRLPRIQRLAPWMLALALLLGAWETVTAKLGLLPMPFFPPPQACWKSWLTIGSAWPRVVASLRLLAGGYFLGAALGFATGVAMGWSRAVGYWIHPVLRLVGPLPATAWLPLAFFVFPSSHSASTFLIALATGFPVTVLTWSGVAGVSRPITTSRARSAQTKASSFSR